MSLKTILSQLLVIKYRLIHNRITVKTALKKIFLLANQDETNSENVKDAIKLSHIRRRGLTFRNVIYKTPDNTLTKHVSKRDTINVIEHSINNVRNSMSLFDIN